MDSSILFYFILFLSPKLLLQLKGGHKNVALSAVTFGICLDASELTLSPL